MVLTLASRVASLTSLSSSTILLRTIHLWMCIRPQTTTGTHPAQAPSETGVVRAPDPAVERRFEFFRLVVRRGRPRLAGSAKIDYTICQLALGGPTHGELRGTGPGNVPVRREPARRPKRAARQASYGARLDRGDPERDSGRRGRFPAQGDAGVSIGACPGLGHSRTYSRSPQARRHA